MVTVHLHPARLPIVLLCITAALVVIHSLSLYAAYVLGYDYQLGLFRMFNPSEEGNLPAWFAATSLLLAAALLAITWRSVRAAGERHARHWGFLALIFLFLAVDEAASIHELFIVPLRELLSTEGAFLFAWVIPYGIAVIFVALAYVRFMLALPRRIALLIAGAGALYVGGALVMEMVTPWVYEWTFEMSLPKFVMLIFEETLEMLGVAIFVYALLVHLAMRGVRVELLFTESPGRSPSAP